MKPVVFHGSALDDLRLFPTEARREAGYQLDKVQNGQEPSDWNPMPVVGEGVKEIRIRDRIGIYRVIYLAKLMDAVHVLHCFQKKTQQTSEKDVGVAHKRYQELMRRPS
jgi:phage-related protein